MPAFRNKVWDGKIRLYNSQAQELPVGLFPYLQEFCGPRNYKVEVEHDNYYGLPGATVDVDPAELSTFINGLVLSTKGQRINPRDYQIEAICEGLHRKRAILLSPTGSGKSLIIYVLMRYLLEKTNKKCLIIVPTTSLVQQMYSDFEDYSYYDNDFVVENECHRIYSGKPKMNMKERIFISTWQSIYKLPGSWFEQFSTVFGDECHGFKSKSLTSIMNKSREAEYRFGTTGTLDGTQTHRLVLEGLFGKVYNVTTTKKLQEEDTLAPLEINVLLLKYPEHVRKAFGKKDYQQLVVIKKLRDELNFGTKIIPIKTVRNKNGLPLSSRNNYLEINEIEIANKINKICKYLIPKVKNKLNTTKILAHAKRELRMNGIDKIDYLTILTDTLEKRKSLKSKSRIFIAANVGSTRLIDNFPI